MKYNNLGASGLKVSELSFGAWLTFGGSYDLGGAKKLMRCAYDAGVNFFDNAEAYGRGQAETIMGQALKEYRRESLVVSTKIFWGGDGPNDTGLSWKHLVEGTKNSLKRLDLEYVDLLFCHRPDPNTPIEETVRAMDHLIKQGYAFYWGTSEWAVEQLEEAFDIAETYDCMRPTMEQPQYNMLVRERVELEYQPLFERYGLGTTIWSPLASGILSGKYNDGVPDGSRLAKQEWLREKLQPATIDRVKKLAPIAKELECSLSQLAIAWCLCNPQVSSVILGASTLEQLDENLLAADVRDRMTGELLQKIDSVLGNKPEKLLKIGG